jgi:hypothetical protein
MFGINVDGTEGAMTLLPAGYIPDIARKSPTEGMVSIFKILCAKFTSTNTCRPLRSQESSQAPPLPLDPVPDGNQRPQHA